MQGNNCLLSFIWMQSYRCGLQNLHEAAYVADKKKQMILHGKIQKKKITIDVICLFYSVFNYFYINVLQFR